MLTNSELRRMARESLQGNWVNAVLGFIIYGAILSMLVNIPILGLIGVGPLTLGMYSYFLDTVRGKLTSVENLFDGFNKRQFGNAIGLNILSNIFIFLWSLLLFVPGIIAALSYSQAYFIMRDNPEITATDALRQSKEMMNGHKSRLFMLYLSFIGWYLLGIISLLIGLLWVYPYIYASRAAFYQELKNQNVDTIYEEAPRSYTL
ncbi:DUF975 family protein [Paenibacillus sp. MZ04-78.2]|uniref:DUF975 family protein n=1 Tax=Paenibacillus sp. MZ04-78.2 TaxID=2962034 RepID=UPI0020B87B8A|nr:DUF975 family protein [Paenibacillus sp. MZ04-78.2]MCP3775256.1 DUF975 family protein [Paenibacillus sp. MZ04-78.2]